MNSFAPAPAPENETNSRNEMRHAEGNDLNMDEVAIVFSFLSYVDIMSLRRVCATWRDAAKKTIVPHTDFHVYCERSYNAMRVMSTALPNLQQITLGHFYWHSRYSDGEDADEALARRTANRTTLDINIISNFTMLRSLNISGDYSLNGRYPVLFNFKYLQQLSIKKCKSLKFDLGMLEGLPSLKELHLDDRDGRTNPHQYQHWTGNLRALRMLKGTLEKVAISYCRNIRGNFMDLADFPRLKELHLEHTNVTGDIRDISERDFSALERLYLPGTVRGGMGYKFQSIAEVPSFMQAIHRILQRYPKTSSEGFYSFWSLSQDSPDWYARARNCPVPPFLLQIIQVGSRLGWSWYSIDPEYDTYEFCEINWLDPEPSCESCDYEPYIKLVQSIQQSVKVFRGYHQPPNLFEYRRLCEGLP